MKVVSLVGARPQFIKEALLGEAVRQSNAWEHVLVHSGQHYDADLSDVFFQELGIPEPKYNLGIGSGSHAAMTAAALVQMEKILLDERPDALLVYGDTNTTLAGALAAAKLHVPVIHVEAGIRMEPKTMPEEINRVATDHMSQVLCCCSDLGRQNLLREGIAKGVHVAGDVMHGLFLRMRARFRPDETCAGYGLVRQGFILATLHRDYNVDDRQSLRACLQGLAMLGERLGLAVLFPLHPRTRKNIKAFGLEADAARLLLTEPLGYVELMSLAESCRLVVTDSGGLQKEAYYAGKRSVVVMPDSGWRELTECGWNILSAPEACAVVEAGEKALEPMGYPSGIYGDGEAVQQVMQAVLATLGN